MVKKKIGAAVVILNTTGHVLLVKHNYGPLNWELPGGGAEANESIIDTAIREVREETGIHAAAERLTGVYYDAEVDMLHFAFLCKKLDSRTEFQTNPEISECSYWNIDELPRPISDFTILRINDALSDVDHLLPVNIGPRRWLK